MKAQMKTKVQKMAKKKKNSILEEQRRAREEFLKLKKMQKGELDPGPKPSEVAVAPKTFEEKIKNFWFHYKWHTIGLVLSVSLFVFLVAQCMSVPKYDLNVIYFTYTPIMDTQTDLIADYFEKYGKDINGDGEVNVQIVNCSISNKREDMSYRTAQLQKLQAMIASEHKAIIYITDKESIEFFSGEAFEENIFEKEPLPLGEEFYNLTESKDFGKLPEGLSVSCRKIKDTTFEKYDTAKNCHKEAMRILKLLEEKK